jgi:hypothetical protein
MSASHPNKLRPPTDRVYLAALAERLAAHAAYRSTWRIGALRTLR